MDTPTFLCKLLAAHLPWNQPSASEGDGFSNTDFPGVPAAGVPQQPLHECRGPAPSTPWQ